MDTPGPVSSVITQVNSHGEQIVVSPYHKDKVADVVKRQKGILSNFLCCLGAKANRLNKNKKNTSHNSSKESVKVSDDDGSITQEQNHPNKDRLSHENGNVPSEPNHNHLQQPVLTYLLPAIRPTDIGRKCMVIDLDETLVHSSFKPISNPDFIVPVEIDGTTHQVYVSKRPYVDEYLQKMGELYECVLFTASLAKYADPVADLLDKWGVFRARLFRESCVYHKGNYVKDLSALGRDLSQILIVDNSPASYIFHPENAVPITSWFDDEDDTELLDLIPFLSELSKEKEIYSALKSLHVRS